MTQLSNFISRRRKFCTILIASLFLVGCSTLTLISPYDEPTDKALTEIQQSSDDFIVGLIAHASTDQNAFEKHKQFYQGIDQQLRRLEFRVSSIPANGSTVKLVGNIRNVLLGTGSCDPEGGSLRDLHCNAETAAIGPSSAALQISQRNVNQTIGAALALELAKKQGHASDK